MIHKYAGVFGNSAKLSRNGDKLRKRRYLMHRKT